MVTVGTFEGLIFVVLPLVRLQQGKKDNTKSIHLHVAQLKAQSCNKSSRAGEDHGGKILEEEAVNRKSEGVYLQVRQLSERFLTPRVGTFVRPVACVDSETGSMTQTH